MQPSLDIEPDLADANERPTIPATGEPVLAGLGTVSMRVPAGTHAVRFGAGVQVANDALSDLIWGCTADGEFDYLGPQWWEYTGIPAEEQLGRTFSELLHPSDAERIKDAFRRAASSGQALEADVRIRRRDGAFRWFRARGRPMHTGRSVTRFCGTCTDVEDLYQARQDIRVLAQALAVRIAERSEQLQRETARREKLTGELAVLREHNRQLAHKSREMEQFAALVSHDLQEPLRAVAGCAQLLRDRHRAELDPNADRIVGKMVEGVERMSALIRGMLELARLGADQIPANPVPAEQALQAALRNLSAVIEERDASIVHDALPAVRVEPLQLTQLFQNLLSNGLKYCNTRRPELQVSAELSADGWCFSVRDNGMGIQPQDCQRIFDVFERLHARSAFPGIGLGLAICKKIVERHHGRIWVESTPGTGSTFRFTLPRS